MKAATVTQPLAKSDDIADEKTLRPLNPRTLKVDLVLPVLNEAHVLEKSASSLYLFLEKNMPYQWAIIIADNGSTDGTDNVARRLSMR